MCASERKRVIQRGTHLLRSMRPLPCIFWRNERYGNNWGYDNSARTQDSANSARTQEKSQNNAQAAAEAAENDAKAAAETPESRKVAHLAVCGSERKCVGQARCSREESRLWDLQIPPKPKPHKPLPKPPKPIKANQVGNVQQLLRALVASAT